MEVSAGETLHREIDERGGGIPLSPHTIGHCGQSFIYYLFFVSKVLEDHGVLH